MKDEKYEEAIKCYTKAMELDSTNAVFPCNRFDCSLLLPIFFILGKINIFVDLDTLLEKASWPNS